MMETPLVSKIKDSLRISWKEGIPAAVMLGIMDYYLVPFALFLGATPQKIGLLVALPHLIASVAQLWAVSVMRRAGSRLKFLLKGMFTQALILIPVSLLAFIRESFAITTLIVLIKIFRVSGNLISTDRGSLESDYLPPEKRGRYFGWRSQVAGFAGVTGIALAGWILYLSSKMSNPAAGFFAIFFLSFICRMISQKLMTQMCDLQLQCTPASDFTFVMFIRRFKESNFVKFIFFVAAITFSTNLAGPYFSVWMLKGLQFNYLQYMAVFMTSVISGLISLPIWGRHADMVGNAHILKITGLLVPVIPILWLFSGNVFYLIVVEIFAGFVWGGFNLCATNFIFDAVSPDKRVRCLGYFSLINGIALASGAALGGFWLQYLPSFKGSSLLTLILLSGIFRALACLFLRGNFQEVRTQTKKVTSLQLFYSVLGVRPLMGHGAQIEMAAPAGEN